MPPEIGELPFLQSDFSAKRGGALPGKLTEIERPKLQAIDTEGMEERLQRLVPEEEPPEPDDERPVSPDDMLAFEFFHLPTSRSFRYDVKRADLSAASRAVSTNEGERRGTDRPASEEDLRAEDSQLKAWGNADDDRTRRAIADGFSDTHFYQAAASYGGCSAIVLSASSTRLVAATAAHCIYVSGGSYSSSTIQPRRNGGASPTWGTWNVHTFGFYPQFLDNDCEDDWKTGCIKHDIALVIASPGAGASPPSGYGWGYRPKSFLDDRSKYRRGYPGCSNPDSPNPCTASNLYGDGSLTVGSFKAKSGGWHRRCRHSSDLNPGDSGSGLYYYNNGNRYVFAIQSASDTCQESCSRDRPNHARLFDEVWFDFVNSVVF